MKNNTIKKTLASAIVTTTLMSGAALAESEPVKIGFLLPYSGTYAALGNAITNGFKLALEQNNNLLGGRDIEFVTIDSQADPSRAPQNMSQLVNSDEVDFVIGPVHSGVAMGMLRVAKQTDAIMIITNAGLNAATNELCGPNIFRTSFSMWHDAYPMGQVAMDRGFEKVVTITWDYSAGQEDVAAFEESFTAAGGEVIEKMFVPFPSTEFQSYLTQIASLNPDAVYTFFAGGGGVAFVRDYAASGLNKNIQLLGSGFVTDGNLEAQGEAAEGILTTLHYSETLNTPENNAFVASYTTSFGNGPDTYAVQGYDAGMMLVQALAQVNGNTEDRDALINALASVELDSPRGPMSFSASHHPIQNIYLREVRDGKHDVVGIAAEQLQVPDTACRM
ncbi:MAG: ABC transporter substrate-binding protein [Saccharospirillum sp.]